MTISNSTPSTLHRAWNYRHRVIFWSSLTAILTYIYQPLSMHLTPLCLSASSPLTLKQQVQYFRSSNAHKQAVSWFLINLRIVSIQARPVDLPVTSTRSIGLSTQISDLNAFIAAAGYVDTSVLVGLSDPLFVQKGWATATFEVCTVLLFRVLLYSSHCFRSL